MASLGLFLSLALLAAVSAAPESRIVGGEHTTIEEFPHMVSMSYFYPGPGITVQRCSGSLLSSWHVLTSGFCFTGANENQFELRVGSTNSLSGGIVVRIREVIKHPDYVEKPRAVDISIVVVDTALGISSTVDVLFLPPQNTYIPDGSAMKIVSWGFEYEGGPQLETLKYIFLNKVNVDTCISIFANSDEVAISDRVICAQAAGRGICFGDDGAPMVMGRTVVGAASFYERCGSDNKPNVFTRVDQYTNWILSVAVPPTRDITVPFPQPRISHE